MFCAIDLRNGFFHVPTTKESIKYTATFLSKNEMIYFKGEYNIPINTQLYKYLKGIYK